MKQASSPCPQPNKAGLDQKRYKNIWRTGVIYFVAFFSISIVGLWVFTMRHQNSAIAMMGAAYAMFCTSFLAAQLYAFVRAHMSYDQTIEKPKYDLLKLEDEEWGQWAS